MSLHKLLLLLALLLPLTAAAAGASTVPEAGTFPCSVTTVPLAKGAPQKVGGTTFWGGLWKALKVILIIIAIFLALAFREYLATLLVSVLLFGFLGALLFGLLFKNGISLGGGIGAAVGFLIGLRTIVGDGVLDGGLSFILMAMYYAVSFPFYVLNQAQYVLSEPWRYFYRYGGMGELTSKKRCAIFEVLKIILYVLLTPLRLVNAIYYNILVHGLVVFYDLCMEVFVPCSDREGADSFWMWLLLLPWRVLRYPVLHGVVALAESVAWTLIDIFIPAITLYHGSDLTAGESIAGSRNRNKSLSWKSGTFAASESSWGGIGVYFAAKRKVALRYARDSYRLSDNNPVVIVCRVSPGRVINYALAPFRVYNAAGGDGNPAVLNRFAEQNGYTTGEWWNGWGGYWEYCLFDWKNLYNSRWRIRPIYLYNDRTHFIQHVKGGMAHWTFNF